MGGSSTKPSVSNNYQRQNSYSYENYVDSSLNVPPRSSYVESNSTYRTQQRQSTQNSYPYRVSCSSAPSVSITPSAPPAPSTAPAIQVGRFFSFAEDDAVLLERAFELRENYPDRTLQIRPTTSTATLRTSTPTIPTPIKITNNKSNASKSQNKTGHKGEMSVDCSICMEVNEDYTMVAAECGHVFHKECVTPWIQQAGTCPSCRVRISAVLLRKIFVSVTSSAPASAARPQQQAAKVTTVNSRNRNKINLTKKTASTNSCNGASRSNNQSSSKPAMNFSRSIYLSSLDKSMTEQSIRALIMNRVFINASDKFSVKSLQKSNGLLNYVSFKISVDSENTFNKLLRAKTWPRTVRVREFIDRQFAYDQD